MGRGGKEVSLRSLLCGADGWSLSEVTMWKAESLLEMGVRDCLVGRRAAPAPVCTAGFPDVGCWALLLLRTTAPWKGLGAHVSTYCPQWVLRKSGSGGAELSDTQDMIAAGHRGWLNA